VADAGATDRHTARGRGNVQRGADPEALLECVWEQMKVLQGAKNVMLHFKYSTNILLFRQVMMLSCDVLRSKFVQVRARVLVHACT
jgi:hypothetical protein